MTARRVLLAIALPGLVLALLFVVDTPVATAISSSRTTWSTRIFDVVSELRGVVFFAVASLVMLALGLALRRPRWREAGTRMLLAVVVSGAVVALVKPVVAKDGPMGPDPPKPGESWLSRRWGRFPSGHTASAFSAAAALASIYPAAGPWGYALGTVVGYERIYRKVHFPSDCFAGAWIGIATARAIARRRQRQDIRQRPLDGFAGPVIDSRN